MFRYVALTWNAEDAIAARGAELVESRLRAFPEKWRCAFAAPDLRVYCTGDGSGAGPHRAYPLHRACGVILGMLFSAGACAPLAALTEAQSEAIHESHGRNLTRDFWGRYVAFLRDGSASAVYVLRDPSATLPCQEWRILGVDVFFSRMADGMSLAQQPPPIDWEYIAGMLCLTRLQTHATGYLGVSQVLGGECIELKHGERARRFDWNLLEIAGERDGEDGTTAERTLYARVLECVEAWSAGHERILHLLSGGLDSAIVLAALGASATGPAVTCLNYFSGGAGEDERRFARLAAMRMRVPLIEQRRDETLDLRGLAKLDRGPCPANDFYALEHHALEGELARTLGATAIFAGGGGDSLFFQAGAVHVAGDHLRHRGWRGLGKVALDAARMDQILIWEVLRRGLGEVVFSRRWQALKELGGYRTLIRREVIESVRRNSRLVHPWFRDPAATSSASRWHVYQLLFPPSFYSPFCADDPLRVDPLYSQPLMELVVRIAPSVHTGGGWNRSLARRSFAQALPREIILRADKGGVEAHARAALVRNIDFVRAALLDGALVRQRILDAAKLESLLAGDVANVQTGVAELLDLLCAEIWLSVH